MGRKLVVQTCGVTSGGKEIRYLSDSREPDRILGMVAKDSHKNSLWCVDGVAEPGPGVRERCHSGMRAALAFARNHFGGA